MSSKSNWLDHFDLHVSNDVYVYQAALLCDDDGADLIKKLKKEGVEDSGESDDFPQGPFSYGGGESDYPQHCDFGVRCVAALKLPDGTKIGAPLGNPLTADGIRDLTGAITVALHSHRLQSRLIGRMWNELYKDSLPSDLDSLTEFKGNVKHDTIDETMLAVVRGKLHGTVDKIYDDLNHVYAVGWEGFAKGRSRFSIWRTTAQPDGSFSDLETVHLPASESQERSPEDILRELIENDAWSGT